MIGHTLDRIQREQVEWVRVNFGGRSEVYPLLGIVEEVGELAEAHRPEQFEDAVGDVLLYLSDYATAQDWRLSELWEQRTPCEHTGLEFGAKFLTVLGSLARARIKGERGIRGTAAEWREVSRGAASTLLFELCELVGEDSEFERIALETWTRVSARDWNRFPQDGVDA